MTKLTFVLAVSLAAFGCKKKDGGGAGDCGTTVTAAVERVHGGMEKDLASAGVSADKLAQVAPTMTAVLLKRCTEDKWGEDYMKCVNEGKTAEDMEKCGSKLPKDQASKIDADLKTAMEPLLGKMDGSPGSVAKPAAGGPADTGSAAPAPAAGSDGSAAAPAAGSDHADGSAAGSGSAQ